MENKIILVTGASGGIGRATCEMLIKEGHKVYGGARTLEKISDLKKIGVVPIKLDVTDEESCKNCIDTIITNDGKIDVLINNAGYGSYGAIEDVSIDEAKQQFEVNVFGLARLIKLVLPHMRKQHDGKIINISSMGGRLVSFMGSWYHGTKYAVEALSDGLRMEVADFGIKVSLIEPGGIKTQWGHIAADNLENSAKGGAYEEIAKKTAESMHKQYDGNMLSDPKVVVKAIKKAVSSKNPKTRYVVGLGAKPLIWAHTILPAKWFDKIMKNAGKLG